MARNQTVIQDSSGNASVVGNLTAAGLIKSGGTASQFLKADGSVDSSAYLTTSGTAANSSALNNLSVHQIFNNMGQGHTAYNDANNIPNFGVYYLNGTTNAPGAGGSQYYGLTLGLGNEYPYSQYATQLYWNRPSSGGNPYLSVRFKEAGTWGSWTKIYAGYSDFAVNLSTDRTNWVTNGTISAVVGQLSWKHYGNNHTIIDASASTAPNGATINNTNSSVAWTATYPTLVGWNGSQTYGVRVDSARVADSSNTSSSSGLLTALGASLTTQSGSGTVRYDYAIASNTTGLFTGSDNSNSILTVNRHPDNYYSQLGFSSNGWLYYRSFSATAIDTSLGWRQLLDSSNYSSYALPLSGGTITTAGDQGITINKSSGTNWNYIGFSVAGVRKAYFGLDSNSYATIGSDVGQISLASPTSISGLLYLTAGISQNNLVGRPYAVWGASSATGPVVIKFPGNSSNYGMIHAVIDIYEYTGNHACTVIVGGHNWNSAWYSYGANVIGTTNKQVRVAFKDGQYCIVIGDSTSTWSYGQVVLRKIQNGAYYAGSMNVSTGYTAAIEADSYTWVSTDLRGLSAPVKISAPIFYDSDDAGYYLNPNGTSNLATLTVNQLNTGDVIDLGFTRNGSIVTNAFRGINFHSSSDMNYYIGKPAGAWTQPLYIHFYTGVHLRTHHSYGGTKFYNLQNALTVASVNDGDNNFRGYYDVIAYASDKRLKHKVKPIEDALDKVKLLTGMTYEWNEVGKQHGWDPGSEREAGVFAQDVQQVLPEAVKIAPFDNDNGSSKSGENFLTVKYEKLVPLLIEAIKEQQVQIEDLKSQINQLKENS